MVQQDMPSEKAESMGMITPRVLYGMVPLAERVCGHGRPTRYNLATFPGYCRHADGDRSECDPITLMAHPKGGDES